MPADRPETWPVCKCGHSRERHARRVMPGCVSVYGECVGFGPDFKRCGCPTFCHDGATPTPPAPADDARRCEGCNAPAVTTDPEDVPLCRPCAKACDEPTPADDAKPVACWTCHGTGQVYDPRTGMQRMVGCPDCRAPHPALRPADDAGGAEAWAYAIVDRDGKCQGIVNRDRAFIESIVKADNADDLAGAPFRVVPLAPAPRERDTVREALPTRDDAVEAAARRAQSLANKAQSRADKMAAKVRAILDRLPCHITGGDSHTKDQRATCHVCSAKDALDAALRGAKGGA